METPKNDINTVRAALFETLKALRDKDNPMDIERAKAVCETAQAITNTAKLEVDFVRATGLRLNSGFIPTDEPPLPRGLNGPSAVNTLRDKGLLETPGVSRPRPGVLVHKMR